MRARRQAFPSLLLALTLGALPAGVALSGCQYDPHPVDGTLRCSTAGECPEGYTCQTNLCYSAKGPPSTKITDYVGQWLLGLTSTVYTKCDDGFEDTALLSPADSPSTMTVAQAGATGLVSTWLCNVTLSWDSKGAHLNGAGQSCTDTTGDPVYTWTATMFEMVTPNGRTATHNATYTRKDEFLDGTVVNCNQTVTAPLLKQP